MKMRPIPAVLSLIVTLLVLFFGWSMYEHLFVKQPISELLEKEEQVIGYEIDVSPKQVAIELQVTPSFTLTGDYLVILGQLKERSALTNITLTLEDNPSQALETTWNELYFIMAEGIAQGKYQRMIQQAEQFPMDTNMRLQIAMDTERLYVWMEQTDESKTLFHSLPLHNSSSQSEVKNHA